MVASLGSQPLLLAPLTHPSRGSHRYIPKKSQRGHVLRPWFPSTLAAIFKVQQALGHLGTQSLKRLTSAQGMISSGDEMEPYVRLHAQQGV